MQIVRGDMIKKARKKRKMTQNDLAEGICKQATISNIENKNASNNINTLQSICERLDLTLDEILVKSEKALYKENIYQIDKYCNSFEYDKAYAILETMQDADIDDSRIMNAIEYYQAYLNYWIKGDEASALFYFNNVLTKTKSGDDYYILSNNGLGTVFDKRGDKKYAEKYYRNVLLEIEQLDKIPLRYVTIFFNIAQFYSSINEYRKAVDVCNQGIEVTRSYQSTYCLEALLYEKAFNTCKLDDESYKELYEDARKVAIYNNNPRIIKTIHDDLKKIQAGVL